MNLHTGLLITRNRIWEQPLTNLVTHAVKTLAKEQGMRNLKLTGCNKISIFPANWIAGVEQERNKDKDKNNEEEYWNEEPDYDLKEELDDEQADDRIDQDEIKEIMAEPGQGNEMPIQPTQKYNKIIMNNRRMLRPQQRNHQDQPDIESNQKDSGFTRLKTIT